MVPERDPLRRVGVDNLDHGPDHDQPPEEADEPEHGDEPRQRAEIDALGWMRSRSRHPPSRSVRWWPVSPGPLSVAPANAGDDRDHDQDEHSGQHRLRSERGGGGVGVILTKRKGSGPRDPAQVPQAVSQPRGCLPPGREQAGHVAEPPEELLEERRSQQTIATPAPAINQRWRRGLPACQLPRKGHTTTRLTATNA